MAEPWGFDGGHGTDVRPAHVAGVSNWAKDESAPGANDGTRLTASVLNRIVANVRALAARFGVALTETGDDDLADCVTAALASLPSAYTEAEADARFQTLTGKNQANGYAGLDGSGKVPASTLPPLAITSPTVVASQAAMLALSAEVGDVAVRSDVSRSYILAVEPASTLGNWVELLGPAAAVLSVAGKTGVVVLVKGDVGLGNVDNTSDATKPVSAATQASLDLKAPLGAIAGQLHGLTLANNATDAINDIDVAAGVAADDTAAAAMALAAPITKRLDAAWAAGTNQGGLDTGAAADGTYHVWLIQRSDTGAVDVLFSASAAAPTMPASYDRKRRIGSILRAAGAIVPFVQTGDLFRRKVAIQDIFSADPGVLAVTRTLSVPTGIAVEALLTVTLVDFSYATSVVALISPLAITDTAPDATNGPYTVQISGPAGSSVSDSVETRCLTNTSAQIRSRLSASSSTMRLRMVTHGWVDTRGRT